MGLRSINKPEFHKYDLRYLSKALRKGSIRRHVRDDVVGRHPVGQNLAWAETLGRTIVHGHMGWGLVSPMP